MAYIRSHNSPVNFSGPVQQLRKLDPPILSWSGGSSWHVTMVTPACSCSLLLPAKPPALPSCTSCTLRLHKAQPGTAVARVLCDRRRGPDIPCSQFLSVPGEKQHPCWVEAALWIGKGFFDKMNYAVTSSIVIMCEQIIAFWFSIC